MKKLNKKGFTITELVIVIAVIAILAGVMIPTFTTIVNKANESAALQEATQVHKELIIAKDNELDLAPASVADLYIVADGYVFQVVNGVISRSATKEADIKSADNATSGQAYYVKDTSYNHVAYLYAGTK